MRQTWFMMDRRGNVNVELEEILSFCNKEKSL